jgi:hypothetical protein
MRVRGLIAATLMLWGGVLHAADLQTALVGKWETRTPRGTETMQFFRGGAATSTESGSPVTTWSYAVLDEGHIRLNNDSFPVPHPMVVEADIQGDTLTLAQGGKIIARYRRVP